MDHVLQEKIGQLRLDILCVNQEMLRRHAFRSWSFQYGAIEHFSSPEPQAFDGQENGKEPGITIHWTLPRSLRTEQVLVPNRWKVEVTNTEEPQKKLQWIVESDCPNSQRQRSMAPFNVQSAGSNYLISPQQLQVFRHSEDSLRAEAEFMQREKTITCCLGAVFPAETWTERSDVPLFLTAAAPANPAFSQFVPHCRNIFSLTFLPEKEKAVYDIRVKGWYSVQPDNQEITGCEGSMKGVLWDLKGTLMQRDTLQELTDSGKLNVSAGNSAYEALSAMLEQFTEKEQKETLDAILLNCPETLRMVGGECQREEKAHRMSFRGKHAGLRYVEGGQNGEQKLSAEEMREKIEKQNSARSTLESEEKFLWGLQKELFDMWWKRGRFPDFPPIPGHSRAEFAPYFDTSDKESLISKTIRQYERVTALRREMPEEDKTLKLVPTETFYSARNPTLLLLGVKPPKGLDYEEVQTEDDQEYQVIWEPMYMEWKLGYINVPFDSEHWELTGSGYRLRSQISGDSVQEYSGVALLGRQTQENFIKRLEDIAGVGEEFAEMISEIKKLPLLTVELTGFHEKLIQRDVRSFAAPEEETVIYEGKTYRLTELLEEAAEHAPYMNWNVLNPFYGIRGGQILIKDIILYDKFGRTLNVVRSGEYSGLLFDEQLMILPHVSMMPSYSLFPGTDYPLALKPRLMQPACVKANLEKVEGMLLVNELEHSLELFSESGSRLGRIEYRHEMRKTVWEAAPGADAVKELSEVSKTAPVMAAWAASWLNRTEREYQEFLDQIEEALYDSKFHSDAQKGRSVYFSKPMTLVKAKISCVLEEEACRPQDWDATFRPSQGPAAYLSIPFLIGDKEDPGDGLVGYYTDAAFRKLEQAGQQAAFLMRPAADPEMFTVYLLMDSTLPVYIHTDLLPAATVFLTGEEWKERLHKLEQYVFLGPLLSWANGGKLMLPAVGGKDEFYFADQIPEQGEYGLAALKGSRQETESSMEVFEGYLIRRGGDYGVDG